MGRVLFRVWVVVSCLWLAYVYVSRNAWSPYPVENVAGVPIITLGLLFAALVWIGGGFQRRY